MNLNEVMAVADQWWAGDFACSPEDLRPARTHVQGHRGELVGRTGIWILAAGGAPLVSLPPDLLNALEGVARAWAAAQAMDPAFLRETIGPVVGERLDRIVGPAYIGYGTAETLDLQDADRAVKLGRGDREAIDRLKEAFTAEEWEHGGSDADTGEPLFGMHSATGELAALAGYEIWGGTIAHIAIITHPAHRGHGLGRAAVALAARHALGDGLVPQYRTLCANLPSMGIASRLGFAEYGRSVYVRLNPEPSR